MLLLLLQETLEYIERLHRILVGLIPINKKSQREYKRIHYRINIRILELLNEIVPEPDIHTKCKPGYILPHFNSKGNTSTKNDLDHSRKRKRSLDDDLLTDITDDSSVELDDNVAIQEESQPGTSNTHMDDEGTICYICKNDCATRTRLQLHMVLLHHTSKLCEKKEYTIHCLVCQMVIKSGGIKALQDHVRSHINGSRFSCFICRAEFDFPEKLTEHFETKHAQCRLCNKILLNKKTLARHMYCHSMTRFKCNICKESFKNNNDNLKRHVILHALKGKMSIKCEKCNWPYRTMPQLIIHMKTCHFTEIIENYTCDDCGLEFNRKNVLGPHRSKIHGHKIEHRCHICDVIFKYKSDLDFHIWEHFECKVCNETFPDEETLLLHSKSHLKQYKCQKCDEEYEDEVELENHILKHRQKIKNPLECLPS